MCSLYLGENLISGNKPINLGVRNIGEIVSSSLPLTDAGLHLLDGSLILGGGIYQGFVDYIAELYDNTPISGYKSNVTKIGSLADNNGVLSGFSASNFAKFPSNFQPSTNTWEMVFKVTTGNDTSSNQYIACFCKGLTNADRYGTRIYILSNKFRFTVSYNGTAWDIPETTAVGTYTVLTNTTYYLKFEYTGSAYILSYSLDGETYTQDISVASSTPSYSNPTACLIGMWSNGSYLDPFLGSIDLKESYININNSRWWTGAEATKPCFCTEEQWQASVSTYGVCGKFVYNSVNNTVRLPKITGIIEGTTDLNALGDLIEAGLPNITGKFALRGTNGGFDSFSGAFYSGNENDKYTNSWTGSGSGSANLDASLSSSVYGNSSTVQPQTIKCFVYIVIANSTKTEIQVDIDQVATDLNGKADTDLTNATDQAKILMGGMAMPSNTYVDLTTGASGSTYTAPANGWVTCIFIATGTNCWGLVTYSGVGQHCFWPTTGGSTRAHIPVRKGDTIEVYYGNATFDRIRFTYAVGSESEAS